LSVEVGVLIAVADAQSVQGLLQSRLHDRDRVHLRLLRSYRSVAPAVTLVSTI
jgi:hypothetical protein